MSEIGNEHLIEYNFYFERESLPSGWEVSTLEGLSFVVTDGTHKTPIYQKSGVRFISIKNIRPFLPINWNSYEKYISLSEHQHLIKRCHPEYDDILFPRIGTLGYAKRIDFYEETSIFVGLGLIKPVKKYVVPKFLELYMNTPYIARLSKDKANGTGRMTLPLEESRRFPVPLPPLNEQHRIVAKIEELFSELDQGIDNLKTAQAQLKVYRQALLKHAFEGKLTAEWRAQNADKLESASALQLRIQHARDQRYQQQLAEWQANGKQGSKPKAPKPIAPLTAEELAELPELPEGWGWTRLIESCAEVVDCHNKTAPYQSSGIPLIRTPSIRNMRVNFDESIRYVSEETYNFWSKRCPPQSGDILFTREAPMGEAGIVPKGKTVCMGQRMMLLRPSKNLVASFLLFSTQTPLFKKISEKVAVGTGVKHLRVGDVEKLIFPICSLDEQKEIAKNLESLFSEIDQLDQTITTSLQQAEALRQSILKKAFSGELVPQDPNDEPAAALLARIQAEKAAQKTKHVSQGQTKMRTKRTDIKLGVIHDRCA